MAMCPKCQHVGEELFTPCPTGHAYFLIKEKHAKNHGGDPWLGRQLGGRFVIESVLGEGSMGKVYRAYQSQVDRKVAIKLFNLSDGDEGTRGPADRDRFVQEARVLAKLSHPNCVTLYDFGYDESSGFLYIAMEYVGGVSLRRAVRRGLKQDATIEVVRQVLMALREAHALDIVHRDLKPENIILSYRATSDEQIVKVLDFGIAKLLGKDPGRRTKAGLLFGTPAYMSPEQCRGETDVTPASDIYSLGCVIFEMLSGSLPFGADIPQEMVHQHQHEEVPPLVGRKGQPIDEELERFVRRCMAKAPEDRFVDAAQALRVFEEWVGDAASTVRLAKGVSRLEGKGAPKVSVPGNRISGAKLDPTGEWRVKDVLQEMEQSESSSSPDRETPRGAGTSSPGRGGGIKETQSGKPAPRRAPAGDSGHIVLVVASVLAVLLLVGLGAAVVYLQFFG